MYNCVGVPASFGDVTVLNKDQEGFEVSDSSRPPIEEWRKTVEGLMELYDQHYNERITVDQNVEALVSTFSNDGRLRENVGNFEEEVELDSFILLTNDWKTVDAPYIYMDTGERGLSIVQVSEKDYVGVKQLQGCNGLEVYLDPSDGIKRLLITPMNGSWGRFERPIDAKSEIEQAYQDAFIAALYDLSPAPSAAVWEMPPSYYRRRDARFIVKISNDELQVFGPGFLKRFNDRLQNLDLTATLKIANSRHGVLKPRQYRKHGIPILAPYNISKADEVILNITRTFNRDNSTILWKAGDIKELNLCNVKYSGCFREAYPLLIGGHGTFEIESNGFNQELGCAPNCVSIVFESELFPTTDFDDIKRDWIEPRVESALIGFPTHTSDGELMAKNVGGSVRFAKTYIEKYKDFCAQNKAKFSVVTRSEICGSLRDCENEVIVDSIVEFVFGKRFPAEEIVRLLTVTPFAALLYQLNHTVRVICKTLESLLMTALLVPERNLDRVGTGVVCEAILCYLIHGKHNDHNKDLLEALELTPSVSRSFTYLWNGLQRIKNVEVANGRLQYKGPRSVVQNVFEIGLPPSVTNVLQAYAFIPRLLSCPLVTLEKYFSCLADNLWNMVSMYGRNHVSVKAPTPLCQPGYVLRVASELRREDIVCCTSYEFVEALFNDPSRNEQERLRDILVGLKRQFSTRRDAFDRLKYIIAVHFDVKIFQSRSLALLYPHDAHSVPSRLSLVLPFAGNWRYNFTSFPDKAKWIVIYYKLWSGVFRFKPWVAEQVFDYNLLHIDKVGFPKTVKYMTDRINNLEYCNYYL